MGKIELCFERIGPHFKNAKYLLRKECVQQSHQDDSYVLNPSVVDVQTISISGRDRLHSSRILKQGKSSGQFEGQLVCQNIVLFQTLCCGCVIIITSLLVSCGTSSTASFARWRRTYYSTQTKSDSIYPSPSLVMKNFGFRPVCPQQQELTNETLKKGY